MPNISKKNESKIINTKGVKKLIPNSASFNKTSDFKKIKNEEFMSRMKCDSTLVKKFREEAQNKKWLLTTLMNEILEERYERLLMKVRVNSYENDFICSKKRWSW